ncbi:Eco57I restriction-modification methylase domain-containing protein [Ornithobacterium rhinotracheale]|uniref:Eco57I restriction-modification methylase domain-containing protein n=1 Tax=Ornithobacterium rhinotracheale TaxID=28251 RepID=UPI001FF37D21|nr:Eco57I restriction-modification methylase domain-containing protein [Ornithobacterium rhinotracheale]MCK0202842.1 Eco57I restriction-modification methylase domain-containing protein [Ornithobacterium rhinotracheale]
MQINNTPAVAHHYNPDVLSCLANLSNDEVFTPPEIANKMLDTLPPELFKSKDTKFLDPFTKSGVFLREIAKRLIKGLADEIPNLDERVQHIMQHQLYGIGITELTALLARRTLYCAKKTDEDYSIAQFFENEDGNIYFSRIQHTWDNDGKCEYCGASQDLYDRDKVLETHAYHFIHHKNPFKNMKFDVIIGNPPYQLNVGVEKKNFAIAIYHKFILQAIKMQPHYLTMIVPSRWFSGGRGLGGFREEMLRDRRLKEIHDIPNSSEVFPGVEIKGGVNYFLWQSDYKGDCLIKTYEGGKTISEMKRPLLEKGANTFIRENNAIGIYNKVKERKEKTFDKFVSVQTPFGILSSFRDYKKSYFENSIKIYGNKFEGYISINQIVRNKKLINKHKVYITKSYGAGETFPHQILNTPFLGEPNSCCTQTYLLIGPYGSEYECKNVISYIKTKFFRFMVMLKKPSQDAMRGVYQFVPQQDFSKPWTDEELYKKYGLTEEEINYIESMVRPME